LVYFNFYTKCFALAVAAVSAELRAILPKKSAKFYNFYVALLILHTLDNSARAYLQNPDIPSNVSSY